MDLHYKVHPDGDHVAKFHRDRPRELGDRVAKKKLKKPSQVKHKDYGSGLKTHKIVHAGFVLNPVLSMAAAILLVEHNSTWHLSF